MIAPSPQHHTGSRKKIIFLPQATGVPPWVLAQAGSQQRQVTIRSQNKLARIVGLLREVEKEFEIEFSVAPHRFETAKGRQSDNGGLL